MLLMCKQRELSPSTICEKNTNCSISNKIRKLYSATTTSIMVYYQCYSCLLLLLLSLFFFFRPIPFSLFLPFSLSPPPSLYTISFSFTLQIIHHSGWNIACAENILYLYIIPAVMCSCAKNFLAHLYFIVLKRTLTTFLFLFGVFVVAVFMARTTIK